MMGTQTAPVVVGSPDPEVFFWKTELGPEAALCSQCGGRGGHWWHPATWALGPEGFAGNCVCVLRIRLVLSQGNEEVPAAAGKGTPAGMMKMKGPMAPLSTVAEQVAAEGLLALASLP